MPYLTWVAYEIGHESSETFPDWNFSAEILELRSFFVVCFE